MSNKKIKPGMLIMNDITKCYWFLIKDNHLFVNADSTRLSTRSQSDFAFLSTDRICTASGFLKKRT